jgi:hypothetical protein
MRKENQEMRKENQEMRKENQEMRKGLREKEKRDRNRRMVRTTLKEKAPLDLEFREKARMMKALCSNRKVKENQEMKKVLEVLLDRKARKSLEVNLDRKVRTAELREDLSVRVMMKMYPAGALNRKMGRELPAVLSCRKVAMISVVMMTSEVASGVMTSGELSEGEMISLGMILVEMILVEMILVEMILKQERTSVEEMILVGKMI